METNQYLRWTKIVVSVASFGMIFPNAIIDGMERTEVPPYLSGAEEEKETDLEAALLRAKTKLRS